MLAAHLSWRILLFSLIATKCSLMARSIILNPFSYQRKLEAFGFTSYTVDGHSVQELLGAMKHQVSTPKCIIAQTVKGKGSVSWSLALLALRGSEGRTISRCLTGGEWLNTSREYKPRALARLGHAGSIFGVEAVAQKKRRS